MALVGSLLALPDAHAQEPAHENDRPRICRRVDRALKRSAPKKEVGALIKGAKRMDAEVLACLRDLDPPEYVIKRAQARIVKRHGIDALSSGPMTVYAVLLEHPRDIAVAKKGKTLVAAGDLLSTLGMMGTVEQQAIDQIEEEASKAFAERGVFPAILLQRVQLAATDGTTWARGTEATHRLNPGYYYVLKIEIPDAIEVARTEHRNTELWIAGVARLADIEGEVRATITNMVWQSLAEQGIPSVMVDSIGGAVMLPPIAD